MTREVRGKYPVCVKISVNKTRTELALKCHVRKEDWQTVRGATKPLNEDLRLINSYLEEVRGKLVNQYQALHITDEILTAKRVKNAYLGVEENARKYTLLWVVSEHNKIMKTSLRPGTLKNYTATDKYLRAFIAKKFKTSDIFLKDLNYEFISSFDYFVRTNSIKENDPCTNNVTMKHMERLKKMVTRALKNEWTDKNPFINYPLKFNRHERDCLNDLELSDIKLQPLDDPML